MTALFTYRSDGLPLADALAAVPAGAPALAYAAGWCGFARVGDARLLTPDVYEVRAFTAAAELRWLRDARTGGALAAVLLSDAPLSLGGGWVEITTKRAAVIGTNPTAYLLWGKAVRSADGWTTLAEARVGAVPVPLADVPEGGRVVLRATEYLAADEFGAAYVLDERLTQLEAADA